MSPAAPAPDRRPVSLGGSPACPACAGLRVQARPALAARVRIEPAEALRLCANCGLGWVVSAPAAPDYEEDYFKAYEDSGSFQGGVDSLPPHLARRLDDLVRLNGGRPGRLLEVGCGFGPFLAAAHARGWVAHGTDVSHYAARRIADRYGLHVVVGDVMQVVLPEGLDVIHMNHALEHFTQPLAALERLRTVLRDGGRLYVEVPNELASLYEQVRWSLLRRATPPMTTVNPHLFFFTASALEHMLRRAGFRRVEVWTERRNVDPDSRLPLGGLVKRAVYAVERARRAGPNVVAIATRCDPQLGDPAGEVDLSEGRRSRFRTAPGPGSRPAERLPLRRATTESTRRDGRVASW